MEEPPVLTPIGDDMKDLLRKLESSPTGEVPVRFVAAGTSQEIRAIARRVDLPLSAALTGYGSQGLPVVGRGGGGAGYEGTQGGGAGENGTGSSRSSPRIAVAFIFEEAPRVSMADGHTAALSDLNEECTQEDFGTATVIGRLAGGSPGHIQPLRGI